MKIIFLDIDGVLNNVEHCEQLDQLLGKEQYWALIRAVSQMPFDYRSCLLIKKMIDKTGAKVVLSSTWRANIKNIEIIEKFAQIKISDRTPILHTIRGKEIKKYILEHPDITQYVIIDDDSDMLPEQIENFCLIDRNVGFTEKDFKKCMEILSDEK